MKSNQNDRDLEGYARDPANRKSYDDFNVLDPSPESEMLFQGDDEDEISDYTLMSNSYDLDFDE